MKRKYIITGGHVIDPTNEINQIQDVYVEGGKIVAPSTFADADMVINAEGKYVFPGLIDYHAHVFDKSTEIGIPADSSMLCQGVTSVVDAGSAGISNIQSFVENVIDKNVMNLEAYINLCPAGMPTMKFHEDFNPKYWDEAGLRYFLEKYPDKLQGLKIRLSRPILGSLGFDVLEKAVALAEKLHTRLCVHSTDPVNNMQDLCKALRPGDILAHCFHGTGATIIDENGEIYPEVTEAKKRGVIFDAANGGNHWSFRVAEAAIAKGLYPDIISTDITCKTLFKDPVFGLPYLMSKYLVLGMNLYDVVKACTTTPAKLMHGKDPLGSLSIGARADIAIFSLQHKENIFTDTQKQQRLGKQLLCPELTLCNGELVYKNILY